MTIMTKICIIQNLLTKQHLNGCHHYRSMIWADANICVPDSPKRSLNSNKTLLKTNNSKGSTYGWNHASAWLKLNPISVVPILMIKLSLGVASCIMVPDPIFRMALFCEMSCWNNINDYHTVLSPYNLTCWRLTTLHHTYVLFWMATSTLYSMKMIFRYHSNVTH